MLIKTKDLVNGLNVLSSMIYLRLGVCLCVIFSDAPIIS